jgi:hypothetical protein
MRPLRSSRVVRRIYDATKELITVALNTTNIDRMDSSKIRGLYVTLDEGRFYFDATLRSTLGHVTTLCEEYFRGVYKSYDASKSGDVLGLADAERMAAITKELLEIYAEFPPSFEPALKFRLW